MESKHSLILSFRYALAGLKTAITKGRNFRLQVSLGALAVILGLFLRLSFFEWSGLILVIASVLILELLNTAIEEIVNIVSPETQERARIAKDVSARAVLIAALAAVLIGAFLFLPKILQ